MSKSAHGPRARWQSQEVMDLACFILERIQQQAQDFEEHYVMTEGSLSSVLIDGRVDIMRLAAEIVAARETAA